MKDKEPYSAISNFSISMLRLRNPKADDLGDVVLDSEVMDNLFLSDEKEFYI